MVIYEYLDLVRGGTNLALEPKVVYTIPFSMNHNFYELKYRIGQDNRLGLLEDFDKKGEVILPLHTDNIQECYDLSVVLYRLAMFMTSAPLPELMDRKKRDIMERKGDKEDENKRQKQQKESSAAAL